MKTIREWLEELPEPYRTQALEAAGDICTYPNAKAETLSGTVAGWICWPDTPQGWDYWEQVHKWCLNPQENDLPPPWVAPTPRNETLRDRIATIIQSGYINKRTSDEVAGEVMELVGRDSTPAG
jgi:hypothetical protein